MLKIAILALENCVHSSVTGSFDIFAVSSLKWQESHDAGKPFAELSIISPHGAPVTAFGGLGLSATAAMEKEEHYDILIVPALYGDIGQVEHKREICEFLAIQHAGGCCIATVCAGAFLAAEAGILDGRKATTHWALADNFRTRFPNIQLKAEKMLVDEGDVITAGGVTAYLDLCLHLVRRFGSVELAGAVSSTFLIDGAREVQLPYCSYSLPKNHKDQEILTAQRWLENNFREPVSIARLASMVALSERTFLRRFKKATGDTPTEYLQSTRIEAARRLLEKTAEPVEIITCEVGYEDTSSFRRLFKLHTGLTPTAYRKRFALPV